MRMAAQTAVVALAVCAALVVGCGGSDTATTTAPSAPASAPPPSEAPPYVAPTNAVCRQMLGETRKLGREFVTAVTSSPDHDLVGSETEGLIRPGVRILARTAARLRAVEARYPDPVLAVYVGLYEPLLQLADLRLHAGEAENVAEAGNLEQQMEQVGAEQRLAAKQAGLRDCSVDFLRALVSSWTSG